LELQELKKLKQLVNEFVADRQARKNKVAARVAELAELIAATDTKIAETTQKLMHAEMSGDEAVRTKLSKDIHDLQLERERLEGLRAAYEVEGLRVGYDEKKLEAVKAQAVKAKAERQKAHEALLATRRGLQEKIKELERELDDVERELGGFNLITEADVVAPVVADFLPEVAGLPHYDKKNLNEAWVDGDDERMKQILASLEPRPEPNLDYHVGTTKSWS
jgi:chromosome segregation ATPase